MAQLNRRKLLKVGLGSTVLIGVGGVALGCWPGAGSRAPDSLRVLDDGEFAVVVALAEAVIDIAGERRPTAEDVGVAEKVDAYLDTLHPASVAEVRTALALLENALTGVFVDCRVGPFSRLSLAERRRVVSAWQTSRHTVLRTAMKALLGLVLAPYWSDPTTFEFVGYPA